MLELSKEARYLTLDLLAKRVKLVADEYKAELTNGVADEDGKVIEKPMRPGERRPVYLELPDGSEVELGGITRSKPSAGTTQFVVTDPKALLEWAKEHAPDMVEPQVTYTIKEWFVANLLADAKEKGAAVTEEGEPIPGIDQKTSTAGSYVSAKPDKEAPGRLARLVADGKFSWNEVLEIEQ